jgi:hypothetical protein
MGVVNAVITKVFDVLLAPAAASPWLGMVLISLITGITLLLIFRAVSNQRGIRATKGQIMSHLLEVLLYRDEIRVVLRAQARLFKDNLRYLGQALVPLAFMIVPVGFMLVQTDLRYGRRPLRPEERAIVSVKLHPGCRETVSPGQVSLSAPAGVVVETPSLRMPLIDQVDWRIRAVDPGLHQLRFDVQGKEFVKEIVIGEYGRRVSTARVDGGVWSQFTHPGESPLPADLPVTSVEVSYPRATLSLFGWQLSWIYAWLILSMAFGYAIKGPLRVQV